MGMFSRIANRATPAKELGKLKPGIALPHITLPTTEVRLGQRKFGQCPLLIVARAAWLGPEP